MNTTYLIIYALFSILLMGFINYLFIKKSTNIDKKEITIQKKEKKIEVQNENQLVNSNVHTGKILFVLMFGMFISMLDQTVLNVALPSIMNELNVNATTVQWLLTGFMLVNGILVPLSAFLVETYGFRKLFITAMIFFTIGCAINAVSSTFSIIMVGRVIQAIGAGMLMPLGMTVFMTVFPPEKRGTAMGTLGIAMILAPSVGPTVSGWVVQNYNWHIMFYALMIIGVIDIIFAFMWFRLPSKLSKPTFDMQGIIYSMVGFGFLLYGFSEAGSNKWTSDKVLISLIIGILFIVLFIYRQAKAEKPLLDLNVLKSKIYLSTVIINSVITMALYGAMVLLPLYLQNIRGFTPLDSGLLLLPGSLIMGIMGPISGRIFDKYGVRALAVVGLIITTYATYEFTKLTGDTPYKTILGFYMLRSFGMSMLMMPIMTAGMNALPQELISHGTAMTNTIRQIAGSIGTAIFVTIMTKQTTNHLADFSNIVTKSNGILMNGISVLGGKLGMTTHLGQSTGQTLLTQSIYARAAKESMIQGINDAFLFATTMAIIALILAFFLKTPKIENTERI